MIWHLHPIGLFHAGLFLNKAEVKFYGVFWQKAFCLRQV